MPHQEINSLKSGSDDAQKKAAASACIVTEVKAGRTPEQARAICSEAMRSKIGQQPGGTT